MRERRFLQNELLVTSRTGDVKRYETTTGRFLQSIGSAELDSPEDVIVGPDGNIYVTDDQGADADNIFRYDASGSFIDVVVPGRLGLEVPVGMAFGPTEVLYVAGWNTDNVVRYDATTGALLGTFVPPGSGGLDEANNVVFGPDDHLYVSSTGSDAIVRYDGMTGSLLGSFVAAGSGGLDGARGIHLGQ